MKVAIIVRMVSVDVKQHWNINVRAQELCESRHNSPYCLNGRKATSEHSVRAQSCVKVVIIVRMISVDVKQHWNIASELRTV